MDVVQAAKQKFENKFHFDHPFFFERDHVGEKAIPWYTKYWQSSILLSALYIFAIFYGRRLMQKRSKYDLRMVLALWNGILAVFSIIASVRLVSESYFVLQHFGVDYSVCNPSVYFGETGIWAMLFASSKAYELGDTLFIVLRKQPLIFLHWYHHVTVLIYSWYTYAYFFAPGRWFATLNSIVHSVMYTYYLLRALQFKLPRVVNISITSLQLVQMIVGLFVNIRVYNVLNSGGQCHVTYENINYSFLMYFSYFILFAHFFYNTYIKRKPKPAGTTSSTATASKSSREESSNRSSNETISNGYISSTKLRHKTGAESSTVTTKKQQKNGYYFSNGVKHKNKSKTS